MSKPTYSNSQGERFTTSQIDRRVSKAKAEKLLDSDGCCERCNTNQGRLTMSHIVSVKYAKENGMCEIAWDVDDLELLCEADHLEVESWTAEERMNFYKTKKLKSII